MEQPEIVLIPHCLAACTRVYDMAAHGMSERKVTLTRSWCMVQFQDVP
jgi:hypothetical protein